MPVPPRISLIPMRGTTRFAPLAAFGFFVREYDLFSPLYSRLKFTQPTHTEHPVEALSDLWVSILAGCRSVSQINTKIRPDLTLAQAWGRPCFAEQSTVARVLNVCQAEQVDQLRAAVNAIYQWVGQAPRHVGSRSPLLVDIDLTGLPAGRRAEGSTKGYFCGKKGGEDANCAASVPQTTTKAWPLGYTQATP